MRTAPPQARTQKGGNPHAQVREPKVLSRVQPPGWVWHAHRGGHRGTYDAGGEGNEEVWAPGLGHRRAGFSNPTAELT